MRFHRTRSDSPDASREFARSIADERGVDNFEGLNASFEIFSRRGGRDRRREDAEDRDEPREQDRASHHGVGLQLRPSSSIHAPHREDVEPLGLFDEVEMMVASAQKHTTHDLRSGLVARAEHRLLFEHEQRLFELVGKEVGGSVTVLTPPRIDLLHLRVSLLGKLDLHRPVARARSSAIT